MKKMLCSIGCLAALLVPAVHAQETPLYDVLHQQELDKLSQAQAPLAIEKYVPRVFPDSELDIVEADVDKALQNLREDVCRTESNNGEGVPNIQCNSTIRVAQELVENMNWLRATIRDWQVSATSYEMGASSVLAKIPSLTKIWQSDADALHSPDISIPIRGGKYPPGITAGFDALANELQQLIVEDTNGKKDNEKFVAAVWRYRNGIQHIQDTEGECRDSGMGTGDDLQFLSARFCRIEDILKQLLAAVPKSATPPLRPQEALVFPTIELENIRVQFWAHNKDVGLQWTVQLDPVLPSLNCASDYSTSTSDTRCVDGAVLSNGYPPELEDTPIDEGLCAHPFAKRGYLCRKNNSPPCPKSTDDTSLHLAPCATPQFNRAPVRITESGPNICGEAGWKIENGEITGDTPGVDDDLTLQKCSNCYIDLVCGACPADPGIKEEDGRIETCINESFDSLSNYIVIRELVRSRQQCNSPPGTDTIWRTKHNTINGCCAAEYQASLVACNAMAEDGILPGVGIEIASCATMLSNYQCEGILGVPASSEPGEGVCGDSGLAMESREVLATLRNFVDENADTLTIPMTCEEAVENVDPRAKAIRSSLPQSCSPDCRVEYQKSIGNAACHIGECIEQSVEGHRIVPGRVPWTPQDEAFPWDAEKNAPIYGKSNALAPPHFIAIPDYKPELLAQEIDKALCQMLGLPVQSPPTLCGFDPRRRLYLPGNAPGEFAVGIEQQQGEAALPNNTLRKLAAGVGARIGSELYVQYFSIASRSLADVVRNANTILTRLEETQFPEEMCKRSNP